MADLIDDETTESIVPVRAQDRMVDACIAALRAEAVHWDRLGPVRRAALIYRIGVMMQRRALTRYAATADPDPALARRT